VGVAGFTGAIRKPPGKEPAGDEAGGGRSLWGFRRAGRGDGFGGGATDTMFAVGIEVAAVIEGGFDRVAGVEGWPCSRPMPADGSADTHSAPSRSYRHGCYLIRPNSIGALLH
jgi:hypothetical protein